MKDCHEKALVQAMMPLVPRSWLQADIGPDPFTRALNLYASPATPPNEVQLCRRNTKGDHLELQDFPKDDQTPNIYITF